MGKLKAFMLMGLLFAMQSLWAQVTVTGRVTDSRDGTPMVGVTVNVKNTNRSTVTGNDGSFSISAPANSTLVFSYIGYQSIERSASGGAMTISLVPAENAMNEVIVTGYTREKRTNFAGSVAKVTAKQINQVPVATIDQILQGRAPGLYVASGSGQPGTAATVIIRGVGTINGSSAPLYVIDGVPIQGGAFSGINSSDIESVDVLKDASATSLYGSRGANGVIVITTKRGRGNGKVVFGFKTQAGIANRTQQNFDMMDSRQRIQYEEEVGLENGLEIGPGWTFSRKNPANAGLPAATLNRYDQIVDSLRNLNVDWRDIFFRQGKFQEYELNASGGSDKVTFYSSLNYFQQQGIALRSTLERFSLRNNVDFKSSRFTGGLSLTTNYSRSSFIEAENTTAVVNPFAAVYYALPYEQPYINGVLVHSGNAAQYNVLDIREGSTALERLYATTNRRNELKAVLSGNFRLKLTNSFALVSNLGVDFRELTGDRLIDPSSYTGTLVTNNRGSFSESVNRFYRLFGNGGINFTKTIASDHSVDVTALYEGINSNSRAFSYVGYGINPLLLNTPVGITPGSATTGFIPTIGGGRDLSSLQSFISIGRYSYKDKYTANLSYRIDGSSSVPEENRWHSFFSVGGSWNISKENFMQSMGAVSGLSLRASYGEAASPFSSSFGYLSTYSSTRYNGESGLGLAQLGNSFYDWEYAKTLNVGVDFGFFKRRIYGSVDVYNKNTENLFISQQLSATSGAGSLNINAGKVNNKGIEVALTGNVVSKADLLVSVGGNFAYNKNEITDLGQVNEFELGTSIVRKGLPLSTHYIVKWAGVDQATGQPLYYDRAGNVTNQYNSATMAVAEFGSSLPKMQGGFNTSINYKGFYLEAFFSYVLGIKRFNNEDYFNEAPGFATSNQSTRMLDRWRKPGDVTDIQKFGTKRDFSSKDIQDASFLRFRNMNIGYNIPAGTLRKISEKISNVLIFVQGQNLHTWTKWRGFDPEDSNNISTFEYPSQRVFTFGLNVNF